MPTNDGCSKLRFAVEPYVVLYCAVQEHASEGAIISLKHNTEWNTITSSTLVFKYVQQCTGLEICKSNKFNFHGNRDVKNVLLMNVRSSPVTL